jgi:thioredoxin reductase (NADPH)
MSDFNVVIIGGGPAALAAGIYVCRGKYRSLLIDKDGFGGNLKNVESIENYPGFNVAIAGAKLASEMIEQAVKYGLEMEIGEVAQIELYSSARCVNLVDGRNFTADALIIASGCARKKLNVPGETDLAGKGLIECALCDGGQFEGKTVAVCGGGDTGVTEALYLTKLASKVTLYEAEPRLSASAILQERARSNRKLEVRCSVKVTAILGSERVEGIEIEDVTTHRRETVKVEGILVDVGMQPNTSFLNGSISLDGQGRVQVNKNMETSVPYIYAAGDVRSDSPGQVVTAVGDGATAAISIQKTLQQR